MKKQSPAHQSQKRVLQRTQVYVMGNFPFFFKGKFGITDHTKARRKNVSETTPGYVFCIVAPRLPYGWQIERFVHSLYAIFHAPFRDGSGRTEWFLAANPVVGTLFYLFGGALSGHSFTWEWYAAAYFFPFIWLDAIFWIAVFWAMRELAMLAVVLIAFYFFSHI